MNDPLLDHRGRPRVAVTGMGVKTPAGQDLDTFWETVRSGTPTAGPIQAFDASDQPVRFACEVRDFDSEPYFNAKEVRRQDRVSQLGFAAAADAHEDAGELTADPGRCAVIAATGIGGLSTLEENCKAYFEKGPSRVSPFFVPMMMPNATAGVISMRYGLRARPCASPRPVPRGPTRSVRACVSSVTARPTSCSPAARSSR
jgi:3-oxoacyl-[acyl-carrier-protein] synthase II